METHRGGSESVKTNDKPEPKRQRANQQWKVTISEQMPDVLQGNSRHTLIVSCGCGDSTADNWQSGSELISQRLPTGRSQSSHSRPCARTATT
jgi:hypothetical protein